MKRTGFYILIFLTQFSCFESAEHKLVDKELHLVGGPISIEIAERWINNYAKNRREKTSGFSTSQHLTQNTLEALTASPDIDGVAFHYAVDLNGNHRILAIPLREGRDFSDADVIIDASRDIVVDPVTARSWCLNFINLNSGSIRYHFFGRLVLEKVVQTKGLERVDIVPAIDDQGGSQLLLFARSDEVSSGRAQDQSVTVYDHSNPCPPFCSHFE